MLTMKIAVYCGADSGIDSAYAEAARELGRWIAAEGNTLVYGGGNAGLMGEVACQVHSLGSEVIGVLPGDVEFIMSRPQPYASQLIVASNMSERKEKMLEIADAFIALPGGIGTLDEISEAITLTKIGVFRKPCILFNRKGFYEPLRNMIEEMEKAGFLNADSIKDVLFSDNTSEIANFLKKY